MREGLAGLIRCKARRNADARPGAGGPRGSAPSNPPTTCATSCLRDADWAGMAHSLEIRVPLVDFALAEGAGAADRRACAGRGQSCAGVAPSRPLPEAVVSRAKTGFGVPTGAWMGSVASGQPRRAILACRMGAVGRRWSQVRPGRLPGFSRDNIECHDHVARRSSKGRSKLEFAQVRAPAEIVLEPGRAEKNYWRDLWRYRELFYVLAARDVAVRYKQTAIGVVWAVLKPFLTMVIFTVIFSRLAKLPSEGHAPYALMVLAGMLPWTFFSTALGDASNSLVANANLVSKVYFPRLIIPTATVVVSFVDMMISFAILVVHDGLVPLRARLAHPVAAVLRCCWRSLLRLGRASGSPRST